VAKRLRMKKDTQRMALTVAGAAGFAWLVNTFPGGDSLAGLVWGSALGHPWLGLATGAIVPNRASMEQMRAQIANENAPPMALPQTGQVEATLGEWTVLARYYREKATEASARGSDDAAREFMRQAEQADAMAAT